MTDSMQPFGVLSSLINGLVLDAVNENALYCSVEYHAIEEEHIHEVYDALLEKFPNMSLTWTSDKGYFDFELKENDLELEMVKNNRELQALYEEHNKLNELMIELEENIAWVNFEIKETIRVYRFRKLEMIIELNTLLKEHQALTNRIKALEADIAAIEAIREMDELLYRLNN